MHSDILVILFCDYQNDHLFWVFFFLIILNINFDNVIVYYLRYKIKLVDYAQKF